MICLNIVTNEAHQVLCPKKNVAFSKIPSCFPRPGPTCRRVYPPSCSSSSSVNKESGSINSSMLTIFHHHQLQTCAGVSCMKGHPPRLLLPRSLPLHHPRHCPRLSPPCFWSARLILKLFLSLLIDGSHEQAIVCIQLSKFTEKRARHHLGRVLGDFPSTISCKPSPCKVLRLLLWGC